MKISVLIATRHREQWLHSALRSVAEQTYNLRGVEVVVVHDGQPGTGLPEIDWAAYPFDRPDFSAAQIHYHEQQQAGRSAAINRAYAESAGRYLTVCDDDDMMHPNKLESLSWQLDRVDWAGVSWGLPRYVDQFGQITVVTPKLMEQFNRKYPVISWKTFHATRQWAVHGTACMYRREVWEHAGPWDTELDGCEEYEFNLRCLWTGATFYGIPVVTDFYRIHPWQKSSRKARRSARRLKSRERVRAKIADWVMNYEGGVWSGA